MIYRANHTKHKHLCVCKKNCPVLWDAKSIKNHICSIVLRPFLSLSLSLSFGSVLLLVLSFLSVRTLLWFVFCYIILYSRVFLFLRLFRLCVCLCVPLGDFKIIMQDYGSTFCFNILWLW